MTEAEWLAATNPKPILEFIMGKASDRKLRFFCCQCCRQFWHLLTDDRSRYAIDVSERFAEGEATEEERQSAEILSRQAIQDIVRARKENYTLPEMWTNAAKAAHYTTFLFFGDIEVALAIISASRLVALNPTSSLSSRETLNVAFCLTLHDIFGNPFRPITINPSWLTSTVLALAQGIYEEKASDRMPILADALLDAGCDNEDVLNHCRQSGEHVRGCWVVDLILSK